MESAAWRWTVASRPCVVPFRGDGGDGAPCRVPPGGGDRRPFLSGTQSPLMPGLGLSAGRSKRCPKHPSSDRPAAMRHNSICWTANKSSTLLRVRYYCTRGKSQEVIMACAPGRGPRPRVYGCGRLPEPITVPARHPSRGSCRAWRPGSSRGIRHASWPPSHAASRSCGGR